MHAAIVTGVFGVLVAVITVAGAWMAARPGTRAANKTADATAQGVIQDGFQSLTEANQAANAHLEGRVDELSSQVQSLVGHVRAVVQHMDSLEIILRDNGVPVPPRPFPHPLALDPIMGDTLPRNPTGWGAGTQGHG